MFVHISRDNNERSSARTNERQPSPYVSVVALVVAEAIDVVGHALMKPRWGSGIGNRAGTPPPRDRSAGARALSR